ncbi:MAG: cell division protein FtsQ/DivIB [Alphaproteobacteria bacterium]
MREIVPQIAPDEVRTVSGRKAEPKPGRQPRPEATPAVRKPPGPSKLSYRLSRAWAKPIMRNAVLVYLPLVALAIAGWRVAADDGWRGTIEARIFSVIEQIAARPEFAVRGVTVVGGGEDLQAEVRRALDIRPGMSSLKLDVQQLRLQVEALGAVETATVQFDPQGTLRISVVERIAVVLFRRADGVLVMLDKGGVEIGPAGQRADHPKLPLILGPGAPDHVGEVIVLLGGAPGIVARLRAFVRVGERRWDLELDHGLTIKLPQSDSVEALSRIMAQHYGEELLDRDIAVIDMRLPGRPTLRMKPMAAETFQIRRAVAALGGEDT